MTSDECILRFKKFLELSRNLDLYWKTVNLEKKAIFSKIAFLNLHVRGTKLANLSVKKPIFKAENGQNISLVQRKEFHLNLKKPLCFEEIWDFITSENGTLFEEEFDQLYSEISDIKLKFPIASNKA
jgi:hypothetical protein